ncbi:MAG: LacI family DNA-binding transcriptional regulator [Longicatena sp.]
MTIKDIAKEAGVSVSAVSLVLNNKPCRVSDITRKKIQRIAKKYNYRANLTARSLVTKKSNIVGLIIPDIENFFFSAICKRMEEHLRSLGYSLIIVNSNDSAKDDKLLIDLLVSRGVDGLFISVSNESFNDNALIKNTLASLPIPFVMIDRYYSDLDCNKVFFDNELGAFLAVSKLIELGHTKIACIGNSKSNQVAISRVQGYRNAMNKFHLSIKNEYILNGDYRFQSGYNSTLDLLKSDASAVFVCNDMMTLGVMRCLQEHHKKIPDDISIVSYDNTLSKFIQGTEITTIDQNIGKLVMSACDILIKNIENKDSNHKTICLEPHLVEKDSIKPYHNE